MTLAEIKGRLRAGKYAWPGGYPIFFIMSDGEAMSFEGVRACWRDIVQAHICPDYRHSGFHVAGAEINWEDPELFCCHTNARIESAYADDS